MPIFLVTYDLRELKHNYAAFMDRLQNFPIAFQIQATIWAIQTAFSANQVRDYLLPHLATEDRLVVARLSGEVSWSGFAGASNELLKAKLNTLPA